MLWRTLVRFSFALLGALVVYVGYVAWDSAGRDSSRNRITRLRAEIEDAAQLARTVEVAEERSADLTTEEDRLELEIGKLLRILPETIVPEARITGLRDVAATVGLAARDFEVAPRHNSEFYSETEITFALDGASAEQIDELIESINKRVPLQKVVELEVSVSLNMARITVGVYESCEVTDAN